jgi:chromosome segregation ATPase
MGYRADILRLTKRVQELEAQLAAREEELRQAREERDTAQSAHDAACKTIGEIGDAAGWKDTSLTLAQFVGSLRAALVEAQSKLSDRQEDLNHAREAIRSLKEGNDSLSSALVEAQEIGARKDEAIRKAFSALCVILQIFAITPRLRTRLVSVGDMIKAALALTQTPNLYREREEKDKSKSHPQDSAPCNSGQ